MTDRPKLSRPHFSVHLVLNPVVEREYAYLIEKAKKAGNEDRVKALTKGLERARRRAEDEKKAS